MEVKVYRWRNTLEGVKKFKVSGLEEEREALSDTGESCFRKRESGDRESRL